MDTGIVWKQIPNFENYEITKCGQIRSKDRLIVSSKRSAFKVKGKVLSPNIGKNGYKYVYLGRGNCFYIHYLVLLTFLGKRPDGMTCSHKDGNRLNNHIDNLFYESLSDNVKRQAIHGTQVQGERCGHAKLTKQDVRYIRSLTNTGYGFFSKLARQFNVGNATIESAYKGGTWKCVI